MKYILTLLVTLLFLSTYTSAQTTLAAGDVAIVRMNSDSPDDFAFVLLKAVAANTKIRFTDTGWRATAGAFQTGNNETHIEWTAPAGGLTAGTVVTIAEASSGPGNTPSTFSTTPAGRGTTLYLSGETNFSLSSSGDQMFAYQGLTTSPTFLFAIQSNSRNWQTGNPGSSNESALPAGLTDGVNAVAHGAGNGSTSEYDNIQFDFSTTSGTPAELLAAIADDANWDGQNSPRYSAAIPAFTVSTFPVEWLSFEADVQGTQVQLSWATASELNNDYFAIERSTDATVFEEIGRQTGAGTSQEVQIYQFTDDQPQARTLYYRLRQVDFDGAFDYSQVVQVEGVQVSASMKLYPNPIANELHVDNVKGTLKLYTLTGQLLRQYELASYENVIDVSTLDRGYYLALIVDENGNQLSRKIVK